MCCPEVAKALVPYKAGMILEHNSGDIMASVKIEEAQAELPRIIDRLVPGKQVVITQGGEAVTTIARVPPKRWPCKAGSAKDTPHWMAPDFDAPLEDFNEHLK